MHRHALRSAIGVSKRRFSTASQPVVAVDVDSSGIAKLSLQQPPVNALTLQLMQAVTSAMRQLQRDGAKAVVLTSSFPNVFCAGIQINSLTDFSEDQFKEYFTAFEYLMHTVLMSPLPTVAAIHGAAPAGGTVLALTCDYRISTPSEKQTIGLKEAALNISPPHFVQALAAYTLGQRRADYDVMHAAMFTPAEALRFGYIDEIVPKDTLLSHATATAARMAAIPSEARTFIKHTLRENVSRVMGPHSVDALWTNTRSEAVQNSLKQYLAGLKKAK